MKTLNAVSNGMRKFANKKYIIPLLILLVIILIFMERGPFGSEKIKELSSGVGTLDMKYGYSAVQAYSMFEKIGSEGRLAYSKLLYLDFVFALVYMSLQSLLITALIKKAKLSAKYEKLNLLPVVRSALDVAENCLLLILLAAFPVQHTVAVSIASAITIVKLTINYVYIAGVFFLGALTTSQTIVLKSKYKETRQGA